MSSSLPTPLPGTQTATSVSTSSPGSKYWMRCCLKIFASKIKEVVDKNDARMILELGVDSVSRCYEAIEQAGKEEAEMAFKAATQLPNEECLAILDEVYQRPSSANRSNSSRNLRRSVKRSFTELPSPTPNPLPLNDNNNSSGSKKQKTTPQKYCPECAKSMSYRYSNHICEHLVVLCACLSASSENLLVACGWCPAASRNKYNGKAFFSRRSEIIACQDKNIDGRQIEIIEHIVAAHSQNRTEATYDVDNAINNILSHEAFATYYDELRQRKGADTSSKSLVWFLSDDTRKLLSDLEQLGGRLVDAKRNNTAPNSSDPPKILELLEKAYKLAQVFDLPFENTTATSMPSASYLNPNSQATHLPQRRFQIDSATGLEDSFVVEEGVVCESDPWTDFS